MFDARIGAGNRQDGPGTSCSSRKLESAFGKENNLQRWGNVKGTEKALKD